jgi:S-DNA-T family DNA segregation ATPase FtsK/SpoIIIE
VDIEKQHYECQTYLAFEGEREIERVGQIRSFTEEINAKWPGLSARRIPVIPATLTDEDLARDYGRLMNGAFKVVTGLDYASVEPLTVSFASIGTLAVTGRESAGRHNWVRYVIRTLSRRYPGKTEVFVVDGVARKLASLRGLENVRSYSVVPDDAPNLIQSMEQRLRARYDALMHGDEIEDDHLLVLLLDNLDAVDRINAAPAALAAYKNLMSRYKGLGACVLLPCVANENIPYSAPEMLKNIRDNHNVVFFGDVNTFKLYDLPLQVTKAFRKRIELGDGYFMYGNNCVKLKTPLCTGETLPEKTADAS